MQEQVILVSPTDEPLGPASKLDSHLVATHALPLHRAFSVFLFDEDNRMLLQKRAASKLTFPSHWTNACCSHPLWVPEEMASIKAEPALGVKRAAVRKLGHELGIKDGEIALEDLAYMGRVWYKAEADGGVWGEHEMDYVLVAQKEVHARPVENEVEEVRYLERAELMEWFENEEKVGIKLTPWFKYIVGLMGDSWWSGDKLKTRAELEACAEREKIIKV
mmetsp:Transcript_22536/g.59890  ORF Transcript_22536/g.59890 Transcript_22536/m.59890 type:complete len:220 (-) Transcript_22536:599-1258(-)